MIVMQRNGKFVTCRVCGKEVYMPRNRLEGFRCCSRKCADKWKFLLVIQRYSWTKSLLKELYLNQKLSLREICRFTNANPQGTKSLRKAMRRYGIRIRHGSEAVRTQWKNADERRKKISELAKKNLSHWSGGKWQRRNPEKIKRLAKRFSRERIRENNPNWKGGMSFYGVEWLEVKPVILKRDNRTCQICGKRKQLHVHHIIPFVESHDNGLDNLVTVCQRCHYNNRLHQKDVYKKLKNYEGFKKAFQREGL